MKAGTKKRIRNAASVLAMIYVLGGLILYFFQGSLLFHPVSLPRDYRFSFDQAFEELNLPYGKNNLSIIKFKTREPRKGIVLFFHGNMYHVEHYKKYPALFTLRGYEIWMIDYPGFGKTTGKRTEKIIYNQALIMYELALREISTDSITLYGKSIGTGVASWLASERKCKQLILETPYYSIGALAKHYFPIYPVIAMTAYSFPNYAYLKKIVQPVTIFHGTEDEVVPYSQGKQLAKEGRHVELITIEKGTHNNLFDFEMYQKKMDSILRR